VARFPNETAVPALNNAVVAAVRSLAGEEIARAVVIIEPRRVRIRRSR